MIEELGNLSALPTTGFRFFAVPLGTTGGAAASVRAFAELLPPTSALARYQRSVVHYAQLSESQRGGMRG